MLHCSQITVSARQRSGEAHTSGWGGRKFLRPRIMKLPVGRYSPVGAVLDTYEAGPHQARTFEGCLYKHCQCLS